MKRRTESGFTLIELVLAIALFAGLVTVYYGVLFNLIDTEEYARKTRAFGTIGPAILDLIEDDLNSLYTSTVAPDAFPFRGEDNSMQGQPADRLNFVVHRTSVRQKEIGGNDRWVRSPVNEVGYRLARGDSDLGDVRRLYRRESYYVDEQPLEGGDYYEVYDHVVAFDVVYAGYQVEETSRESQDTLGERELEKFESWDSDERKGFPTAVIITLTIKPPPLRASELAGEGRRDEEEEKKRQMTFVRVIPIPQAEDIPVPEGDGSSSSNNNSNTNNSNR